MQLRQNKKIGRATALAGLLLALVGCQTIDNVVLPGGSPGASTPGVQLGTTNFTVPGVSQFPSTGTAVGDRIEELRDELGLETLLLWSNFPGVPHDKVMRSIQLFNEEVLPHFQPGTVKLAV